MTELNDIFDENKGRLPEKQLLAYLEGRLPADERLEVEVWLHNGGMEEDAIEGLLEMGPTEAKDVVQRLNTGLDKTLKSKKNRRKQPITNNYWALIAIIIILLVAIVGYLVLFFAGRQ